MSIVITTPTGKIGKHVLARALAVEHPVTVIARDPDRLPEADRDRVQIVTGGFERDVLLQATTDATTLFVMFPDVLDAPDMCGLWREFADNVVAAAGTNGVQRVVYISIEGAHESLGGMVRAVADIEAQFMEAFEHVVALRPGYFMQNLFHFLEPLKRGELPIPLPQSLAMPVVSTRDIADVAADYLLAHDWTGHHIVPIYGPADLTPGEMAEVLSRRLSLPIRHREQPLAEWRAELIDGGAAPRNADYLLELYGIVMGPDWPFDARTDQATTPTTFESFVDDELRPRLETDRPLVTDREES